MWQILKANTIDPSPDRSEVTWSQILHSQAAVACDFFTIDTALLRRCYVLFFIHIPTRQIFYAGTTTNPVANAFAERRIGPIRRELLDRTIIWTTPTFIDRPARPAQAPNRQDDSV